MKYLKIHIRGDGKGGMVYPNNYQSEIGVFAIDHLYYDVDGALELLLCIPDKEYKETMVRTDVDLITETEAKAISESKEVRTETIKDEVKVRRLEILSRLGTPLTKEDRDSLDITKPNSVFGASEILADRVTKLKVNEVVLTEKIG